MDTVRMGFPKAFVQRQGAENPSNFFGVPSWKKAFPDLTQL